jgi:hypothetical protein
MVIHVEWLFGIPITGITVKMDSSSWIKGSRMKDVHNKPTIAL